MAPSITSKNDDYRYLPGLSDRDDDMSDHEWFEAMGQPIDTDD